MTVSQTETTEATSPGAEEERIRKIYVKDVKNGGMLHTVFKAVSKEKHSSRSGKTYLAVSLVDKTGQLDARVFENVEPAEAAFSVNDYLLVKGKVGVFHGTLQLVIDRLERLDPEPIDPTEFEYTAPLEPVKSEEPTVAASAPPAGAAPQVSTPKSVRQRVLRLLDDPKVLQALEVLLTALEAKGASSPQAAAGAHVSQPGSGSGRRRDRRDRGPRVERKPGGVDQLKTTSPGTSEKPELKRDPGLPEGLSFKPLTALVGEPGGSQS